MQQLHQYPSSFGSLIFGFVILYITKRYKVNSSFKEKVNIRYEFITGLRWLRASSPAKLRPPFAQIWVTNLFPMLRARPGMSFKSTGDKLKFSLFTVFPCVQLAFIKATAVPREVSRAQKSPCPAMTSSRASTLPSIWSKMPGRFSAEGLNFSELAPTELKNSFSHCTQWLPKFRHLSWSSLNDFCKFELFATSSSSFASKSFFSCSKLLISWWVCCLT